MKKRIISFVLVLIMLFGITPMTFLTAFAESVDEALDRTPKVSIEPETVHEDYGYGNELAKPDASGYAHFVIKVEPAPETPITVSYTTADLSAIADTGDYYAQSGTIVLTKEAPERKVVVSTKRTEFSVSTLYTSSGKYPYDSRRFEVVLTDVSEGAELDEENSRAQCALNSEYHFIAMQYSGLYNDGHAVFSAYTNCHAPTYGGRYLLRDFLVTSAWSDEDKPFVKSTQLNFPMEHWDDYLYSSLDADLYMSFYDAHVDESSWNSSSMIEVGVGGVYVYLKGEFHDDEDFGWGPALAYVIGDNAGEGNRYKSYFEDNFRELQWSHEGDWKQLLTKLDGKEDEDGLYFLSKEDIEIAYDMNLFIAREYDSYGAIVGTPDPEDYWVRLSDNKGTTILEKSNIEIRFWTYGGFSRRLTEGDVAFRLEDLHAPVLEQDGNEYSIYNNFGIARDGDKLRLTFRFSEPVQVFGKTPYISGKVNGRGTGALTDPYTIRFDYVGGSGTDTLYFEADYTGNYHITSVTDLTFTYGSNIMDFAGLANSFSAGTYNISGISVDRRNPVISVDNTDYVGTSNTIRSTDVDVTVSQITDGATLYYAWTDSESTPDSYDKEVELNSVSIYETQSVNIVGGGDGKKYLHLKVTSKYGKTSTIVCNSKTGITKSFLGPYYFDNSAPTIDETVLPKAESDMKQKIYTIPLPTDNPNGSSSGFKDMKIYCLMPDGTEILVGTFAERQFSVDVNGKKYLNFTLNSTDLGIGEKTRVENITVSFVLTDNLGNTVANVSSHKIVFDTNEYVEVVSAGSSQAFADETERLDGENTLIYSNDKAVFVDGKTVYYSFEFNIREETVDCENLFKVVKIGDTAENSRIITEGYSFRTVPGEVAGEKTVILDFTSPIEDGCYDIQLMCYDQSVVGVDLADRVSETYRVYIGSGVGRLGEKINEGTMLINKVYQLPSSSSFYYLGRPDDTNAPLGADSVFGEYYNPNKLAMSFSSIEQARKFVLFHEYRDLYAITLTAELAEALNNKTTSAQPAHGETTEAKAGQVWIRYKSVSWTIGSKQSSNWVYYYYGSTDVLDPDNFSPILKEALNYVADTVTNSGKMVALTDLSLKNNSGESLVDKNGVPYLDPSQIISSELHLSDSVTKISKFVNDITYAADVNIYSSNVVKSGSGTIKQYTLVGNVNVPLGSRFQYRMYNSIGSGYVSTQWNEIVLNLADGTERFADVIAADGWYEIRELGIDGVLLYDVYIDKKAPSISISWNDKNGNPQTQWLNSESEKDFRAGSFGIMSIDSIEVDKYSYVAIYNMMDSSLYGVYTVNELQKASVTLQDGKYYLIVSDRSGNSYYLSIYVNSSNMNCDVEETENVKIKFTCDRDSSQIQAFYVKRNGVRIEDVQYANSIAFTESGTYEFYVEDIYGNSFGPYVYEFTRDYPELIWSYLDVGGYFTKYDETKESGCFKLEKLTDGSYRILSSTQLRFQMKGDYVYEFIGADPGVTKNDIYGYVTINSTQSFQLKVSYRDHPEVYSIYNCAADKTPPTINVSATVEQSLPAEIDLIKNALANGNLNGIQGTILQDGVLINGKILTPSTIAYLTAQTQTQFLVSGDTVLSDFISVTVKDDNGLWSLDIYLDGELINRQTAEFGIEDTILSRYGEYRIVAEDMLGNIAKFNFKNSSPDAFEYHVDGKEIELGLHDYQYFDENLNYTHINYGNASVSFTVFEQMSVFYMITDTDGKQKFVAFNVQDGVVRSLYYFLKDGETSPELVIGDVLFDGKGVNASGSEYQIFDDNGTSIFAKLDSDGNVVLKVYSKNNGVMTVEARLNTVDGEFYYNRTELSKISFDLAFKVDGVIKEPASSGGRINVNNPFEIIANENTVSVEVYFSKLNDIDENNLSGRENLYGEESYSYEGFYLVKARDKYGNECMYRIHLSDDFDVTSYVEFSDGQKTHYSPEYKEILYSNSKIVFELHSNDVVVVAKKDGKNYRPDIICKDGITCVILDEVGSYTLSMSDTYGNTLDYQAQIDSELISFNENLLTGYNENALKKQEGYTNQKLSIVEAGLEGIYYLAVRHGDKLTVIFDSLNENTVGLDSMKLFECIGNSGDGEYTVIVRNRYGSIATKTIHYRETPTLRLERATRSSTNPEIYSLSDAETIGFWSNNSLSFATDALVYIFTINGDKTECPKTIFYENSGQYGRHEYEITYVDEYGFSYSFKAYLVREDLEISESEDLTTEYINDVLTTKDDVSVVFSDNAFCTYTLNNSEPKVYTPGEKLSNDGVYRFTVSDYAGNVAALTIKKDTVVEFYFKTNNSSAIQSGEIVNYSKVEFGAYNNDTVYIEKVIRNGVVQTDFNGSTFSEDGKWEVIIADEIGNKSYFSFYIITHAQNGFAYTTPYEYHITQMWYEGADGVKISYMNFVNHSDFTSSFDFTENGKYTATMISDVTGALSTFEFTVNTTAPNVHLVGCDIGETTINDVTLSGCKVGDRIKIYKLTDAGEKLVKEVEISSIETQIPTINEGGSYRVVVESEAGVATELNFVRKHVMNTAGSIFIIVLVCVAATGLFAGLVYRNKSKTDD